MTDLQLLACGALLGVAVCVGALACLVFAVRQWLRREVNGHWGTGS